MRATAPLALFAALLALPACSDLAILDVATVLGTDKTIPDHVISYYSGKDCSTIRTERGQTYCVEDEPNPEPLVHCYRTLGRASCYTQRDPHHDGQQELGNNDHNTRGVAQ